MEERTWIHAFTDGEDVSPTATVVDLAELPAARLATVVGRYYAMDRDGRWERAKALDAITKAEPALRLIACWKMCSEATTPASPTSSWSRSSSTARSASAPAMPRSSSASVPTAAASSPRLLEAGYDLTTMTRYSDELEGPVAFGEQVVEHTLAEALAAAGARQLHAAETEKYAHVTYFFNGGVEQAWAGETRILVPSPRDVPSYDYKPGNVRRAR